MSVECVLGSVTDPILHSPLVVSYIHILAVVSWWVSFTSWLWTWPCDLFWPMGCELTRGESLEMLLCSWSCCLVFHDPPREKHAVVNYCPFTPPLNEECGTDSNRTWRAALSRATLLSPAKIGRTPTNSWIHEHENEWLLFLSFGVVC